MAELTFSSFGFTDEQFNKTCIELENPQIEGWEFFVQSHGVTIYRKYNEVISYLSLLISQHSFTLNLSLLLEITLYFSLFRSLSIICVISNRGTWGNVFIADTRSTVVLIGA